jgi:hypothetical protein
MVNLFNENNKLIKEQNKSSLPKTDQELQELVERNKKIQSDCE